MPGRKKAPRVGGAGGNPSDRDSITARRGARSARILHRDAAAWAHFMNRPPSSSIDFDDIGFHPILRGTEGGSVRVEKLARFPARLAAATQEEAVISISSYHRPGESSAKYLRRLNAVWVDCDCGPEKVENGIDYPEAVGLMLDLEARRVWPKASAFVFSGDGAWALWLPRARGRDRQGQAAP